MTKTSKKSSSHTIKRIIPTRRIMQRRHNTIIDKSDKKTRDLMLIPIVQQLYTQKLSYPNNKLPHQAIQRVYNDYKHHYPWLTLEMIKGRLKCLHRANKVSPTLPPNDQPNITKFYYSEYKYYS
jgi:hypothetical protein